MTEQQFNLGFGYGDTLNTNVDFTVQTLKVDNLGSNWIYQPDTQRYVPPYTSGAYLPVELPSSRVNLIVQTPPGHTPYVTGNAAVVTATDTPYPYSPGVGIPDPTAPLANLSSLWPNITTGNPYAITLPFAALSATVDNPGGRWISIGNYTIPPWSTGATVLFPTKVGPGGFNIYITAPAGQQNTQNGNSATVVFYDTALTPTPPVPIGQNLSQNTATPIIFSGNSNGSTAISLSDSITWAVGQTWHIASISAHIIALTGNPTKSIDCNILIGYGTSIGTNEIYLGAISLGTGSLATSPGESQNGIDIVFNPNAMPSITTVTGGHFWAYFLTPSSSMPSNDYAAGVTLQVVPSVL